VVEVVVEVVVVVVVEVEVGVEVVVVVVVGVGVVVEVVVVVGVGVVVEVEVVVGMKPKPDWKKLYEQWHERASYWNKRADELRIERDAAERRYQEMVVKAEMPRPFQKTCSHCTGVLEKHQLEHYQGCLCKCHVTVEKIVEKEVLPWWTMPLWMGLLMAWIAIGIWGIHQTHLVNQTPIHEPYSVFRTIYVPDIDALNRLDICKDAWRQDERTIRKLQRHIEQEK
jgi:hypothetical protein